MLPEGDPRRVGQPLGTAAVVAYSSGRRGPCGEGRGAGLRKWPRVLPGTAYTLPTPRPHSPPFAPQTAPCSLVSQLVVRQAPSTST